MAKYVYGNTLIAFEVAKSNDVATEFQAVQTMSAAEEIRTNEAIKFPAGEGNDIRITENAGQRATKVLAFDATGDLELQTGLEAAQEATTADVVLTNADVVSTNADVVSTGNDATATAADAASTAADVGYAEEWAIKPEDSLISVAAGGNGSSDYSALHHAAKAAAMGYEVGTWTPRLYSTAGADFVLSSGDGTYTRIGDQVHINQRIIVSSAVGVSGAVRLDGLPYGIISEGTNAIVVTLNGVTAGYNTVITTSSGVAYLIFQIWDVTTGVSALDASELSSVAQMSLSITYKTNDAF